ncbi:DNA sulfur modification protein DndD [Sphingobium lignivorans]|uniref:DNA sulfur modification protein DndD n=1 Tax=Sphingobium lignivorans TaxID=2735886 RepID=A0ABR6NKQ8_9SPHN|nr:DNA sulfur modification protein DndD [Sphingobium lignivorans]MBB5987868.1 DNA sulfur modification protein DndD [Sphingobium lignivorans]
MILDELVLHDFGVYGGRQRIALTPTARDKPIILFGGLNGGGKTTLLDALQLCFFGNVAQCAGRGDLTYDEYLRRSVHHGAEASEAAIEVAFRHTVDGEVQNWRLTRSWSAGEQVRERFQVIRNDRLDRAASEQWSAQVEDFIPARIAHLFLFDGEKVEGYADLAQAPILIRTAIQNLLGLDIVERLNADLVTIERRKKTELKAPEDAEALNALRDQIRQVAAARSGVVRERAAALVDIDRLRRTVSELDQRYQREGGSLYEDRGRLEAELSVSRRAEDAVHRSMRDLAAGAAPLALVTHLLDDIVEQAKREELSRRSAHTAEIIADEHAALLQLPALAKLSAKDRAAFLAYSTARIDTLRSAAGEPCLLELDAGTHALVTSLLDGDLTEIRRQGADLVAQGQQLAATIEHAKLMVSAIPSEGAIADLISQRDIAHNELRIAEYEQGRRDAELSRLDRELETLREKETRLLESVARAEFEREDVSRILIHSSRVRETLGKFRTAVVERHVRRIEAFVLDSFRQLMRKENLITGLRIDPSTFHLELKGSRGRTITAERLSAGERQLLAIAIIWGLARASGRPLPTVIDTPLGRLDSAHRSRLVTRYFPHASHQVMLLSTDEEITRRYYRDLKHSVGRSYRLRFDEDEARTIVEEGYFPDDTPRVEEAA